MTELLAIAALGSFVVIPLLYLFLCIEVGQACRDKGYSTWQGVISALIFTPFLYAIIVICKSITIEKQAEVQQELFEATMRLNASK